VISEQARERRELTRALDGLPGVEIVAEVDLVCQMGQQAGHIEADCVVLDIDRYPLAGTLGLAQTRGTFPSARIMILVRAIHPRFVQFLKESGASCCIDNDDPDRLTQLMSALHGIAESFAAGHHAEEGTFQ
jgi:DNA-binding NarL/FixJ family response regulator